ncbi:YhdP family protein [Alteromonas halophila]|uniref:DUF3971 domain-containing protein n=1 Tax=Alteromonas halophila TaxID=516698 RepID=A0A918MY86_9ALTE|nr:YhdP family protein [Alteromonas halophila]GGW84020.1 DUF3971 domain-containing protein [Alteromonas halophila]
MTKFSSAAAYLVKKVWLLLAVVLVLFAVLLSVMRYALPHIEHKKHLLEDYVNQQYGVNLSIDSVHAVWQRSGPSIVLENVALAQDARSPVALQVDKVYVEVDFWQSLTQQLVSSNRFELVGLDLDINTDRLDGSSDSDFPVVEALKRLFLEQLQQFSLRTGEVSLTQAGKQHVFDIEQLSWLNRDARHQGRGTIQVRDISANSASFIIDLHGNHEALKGTFYAKAEELDISPYVSDLLDTKRPLTESRANFEIWADIVDSDVAAVQMEIERSLLQWGGEAVSPLYTGLRAGSIQALPHDGGWNLRVDQLILDSVNQTMVTDLIGKVTPQGEWLLNTVKPVPISPFLMLTPLLMSEASEEELQALNPQGQLATLQIRRQSQGLSVAAKLLDVSWNQTSQIPGMSGLEAELFWDKQQGAVLLSANDEPIAADKSMPGDFMLDALRAELYVYPLSTGKARQWELLMPVAELNTDKISLSPAARYNLSTGHLDVYADIDSLPLAGVDQLFPDIMGEKTAGYLSRAFAGQGQVENARILFSGKPQAFPYPDNSGIFQAYVSLTDSDFMFSPDWPALSELDLNLYFVNDSLVMESERAMLDGVEIRDMSAAIPGLSGASTLSIYATGAGTGESLTSLMTQSGIADSLGKVLDKQVQITGPVSSQLALHIPLNGDRVTATGTATLTSNPVYITATNMQFNDVSGDVSFNNDHISATALSARLLEQPLTLTLEGQQQQDNYNLTLAAAGQWDTATLLARLNPDFQQYVAGVSDWQAEVALLLGAQSYRYTASIAAQLAGVASDLPAPFNNRPTDNRVLRISSEGDETASTISADVGDSIRFDGLLPHAELQFSRAHLALGNSDFTGLGMGFSISADLPQVDIGRWYDTVDLIVSSQSEGGEAGEATQNQLFAVPERIFVKAGTLQVGGQTLKDVDVTAKQRNKDWQLDINAAQARATVNIYDQWLNRGIEVDADFMQLQTVSSASDGEDIMARSWRADTLPPIYLHCQQCTINDIELGEVILDVERNDKGMLIKQASANSKHGKLVATGQWNFADSHSVTRMTGTLDSNDVGDMLESYGVQTGIKDSEADISFVLSWPDSPMDFTLEKISGEVDWGLTDGYLTELSDQGSRIFTLFSLNSLVRKLSLDFRDVFAKGFFYDEMGGSLRIADGKAFTDDTEIDGGAGDIEIRGYTDLKAATLNYDVSFTPNVTGNLPVLVYFLATPPTALAALAIDQVLTSAKVISNVNYKVSGTLNDPVFEEVGRDSKDISLPAQTRPSIPEEGADRPLMEDDLQRLNMEVIDG